MDLITLFVGIASFLIALAQFVKGVRVQMCLRKIDLALSRQRLLEQIDSLRGLEAQVQLCFDPRVLEKLTEGRDAETARSIQVRAEEYNKGVAATLQMREMIVEGTANTPYALKLIETHVTAARDSCTFLTEHMPGKLILPTQAKPGPAG